MSKINKIHLPSSGGGIVRYSEESASRVYIKPEYFIAAIGVVILLIIVLHRINPLG